MTDLSPRLLHAPRRAHPAAAGGPAFDPVIGTHFAWVSTDCRGRPVFASGIVTCHGRALDGSHVLTVTCGDGSQVILTGCQADTQVAAAGRGCARTPIPPRRHP